MTISVSVADINLAEKFCIKSQKTNEPDDLLTMNNFWHIVPFMYHAGDDCLQVNRR